MKSTLILSIVACLFMPPAYCVAQQLDPSFGTNGKVVTALPDFNGGLPSSSAIQSDGKIIVAGAAGGPHIFPYFAITRYNVNGTIDSSFGNKGSVVDDFSVFALYLDRISIAIQPDQKIIITGFVSDSNYIGVARYNLNGKPDSSFGVYGKTYIPYKISDLVTKTIVTADNKILLAATVYGDYQQTDTLILIHLKNNGQLDSSFGINGFAINPIKNYPDHSVSFTTMQLQKDNKIILGGVADDIIYPYHDFILMRCNTSGNIDLSFGDSGKVIIPVKSYVIFNVDIAIQPDQKILITGNRSTYDEDTINFCLARYTKSGIPDSSFGNNSIVITKAPADLKQYSNSLIINSKNEILVSGENEHRNFFDGANFVLAKYTPTGKLDSTFGSNGTIETHFDDPYPFSSSNIVLLQKDSKILQIGYAGADFGHVNFALARYIDDGTLPITLSYFSAIKKQSSVLLKWQTASEQNNAYFTIERSLNLNNNFIKTGAINSKGNSTFPQQYSFEDLHPLNGNNFYRLKQTDRDGKFTYSNIEFVDFDPPTFIKIYPNPTKDFFTLEGLQSNIQTKISIVNSKGRVVAETSTINNTCLFQVKQFPAGIYYVRIESGDKITTLKFIKE